MTSRRRILEEIQRTAEENNGQPLGERSFREQTGILRGDWFGKYWSRWGAALEEAGFQPNELQTAYDDDHLLSRLSGLVRELGHFPVGGELRLKRRQDPSFPSHNTFLRFGRKAQQIARLIQYCEEREELANVLAICAKELPDSPEMEEAEPVTAPRGSVYLLKSGRYYKIGQTNSVGRRARELAIQLPEKSRIVHEIETDDPVGIESYWHNRFRDKRRHGEWFQLSSEDVKSFKRRRKFM